MKKQTIYTILFLFLFVQPFSYAETDPISIAITPVSEASDGVTVTAKIVNTSSVDQSLGMEVCGDCLQSWVSDNPSVVTKCVCLKNSMPDHPVTLKPGASYEAKRFLSISENVKLKSELTFKMGLKPEGYAKTVWSNPVTIKLKANQKA